MDYRRKFLDGADGCSPEEIEYRRRLELAVCARDILHWWKYWVWTDDPREEHSLLPMDLFPHQGEFLLWLQERERNKEDGVAEKSRDVGFTWLCIGYATHGFLFRRGFKCGFGSRKLDLVDKLGDPDTILEKGRILLRNLPRWMLPDVWVFGKHDGYCRFTNPTLGSNITGEGGDNIGRGGRKTIYFKDESAFLARPDLIERSLSANSNCVIDVSTPNGPGNAFARKRHGGKVPVFTFHWTHDPRKTPEWAKKKRESLDEVTWAQEYEIDYNASIEGICIPAKWVRAAVDFPIPGISQTYPLRAGFDVADGGRAKSVFITRRGPVVMDPFAWGNMTADQAAHRAAAEARRLGVEMVNYDAIGVGTSVSGAWKRIEGGLGFTPNAVKWGDPPTNARWPSGRTSADMFANLRAELWWILRVRFEKTYQVVTEGASYPADELISIPNDPELIAQLSLPLCEYTSAGKIQLESKSDMSKRGVASPDYGDALAYSFAPAPKSMDFF